MSKINFFRQPTSNMCGPTSLRIILDYYGTHVLEWEIAENYPQQKSGWDAIQYAQAAFSFGLKTELLYLEFNELRRIALPIVLFAHNHYVVLYKITANRAYIADPKYGSTTYSINNFTKQFCSNNSFSVFKFTKLPTFEKNGKTVNNLKLIKEFCIYFRPYKSPLLKALVIVFVIVVAQTMLPFITRAIIDIGIQTSSWDFIELLLVGNIILVLADIFGTFTQTYLVTHVTNRIKISMLEDYMRKLLITKYFVFMGSKVGDLLQRISDNERIQSFLSSVCLSSIVSLIFLVIFSLILLDFNQKLFIVYTIFAVIYIIWTALFLKQRKKMDFNFWHIKSDNSKILIHVFDNIVDIKGFNLFERYMNKWKKNIFDLFEQNMSFFYYSQVQEVGSNIILQAKNLILTYLSCRFVLDGNMTLGTLFAVQYIIGTLNTPLYRMADFFNQFQLVMISLSRIYSFNSQPDDSPQKGVSFIPKNRNLMLSNVSFQYPDNTLGLSKINMNIVFGNKYAIVGQSGCGKSTLLKIICDFIQPQFGEIWLGSTNTKSIDDTKYRDLFSMDLQENNLIEGSILENIVGDTTNFDEDRMIKCVEIASIRHEIESLAGAYNTLIEGDNRKLSRGQTQRILIARAIYKQADIYVFDEIANCLNVDLEKKIVSKIDEFLSDKTRIYVSHRPECLSDSTLLFFMAFGSIVDLGTYDDLSKRGRI